MTIEDILDELDGMIDRAWNLPLTGGKCVVDAERVRELLDDVRINLPTEIKQAKAIVADRSEIIAIARRESETILRRAEERAKQLVSQEEITRQAEDKSAEIIADAQNKANEIISSAGAKAKEMKAAANEFANSILKNSEETLSACLAEIKNTRTALNNKAQ